MQRTVKFLKPLADRPFATALAGLLLLSTAAVLGKWGLTTDALKGLVPEWLLIMLAITYGIGGILILIGILLRKGNLEAAGCVLVGNGLLIRMIAVLYVLGFGLATVTTCMFYVLFGWACAERFRQILRDEKIIRVHEVLVIKESDGNSG